MYCNGPKTLTQCHYLYLSPQKSLHVNQKWVWFTDFLYEFYHYSLETWKRPKKKNAGKKVFGQLQPTANCVTFLENILSNVCKLGFKANIYFPNQETI